MDKYLTTIDLFDMKILNRFIIYFLIREKVGGTQSESVLISQLDQGLSLEFERSDCARRIRLVLSEIFFILGQVRFIHDYKLYLSYCPYNKNVYIHYRKIYKKLIYNPPNN